MISGKAFWRCAAVLTAIAPLIAVEGWYQVSPLWLRDRWAGIPPAVIVSLLVFFVLVALTTAFSGRPSNSDTR